MFIHDALSELVVCGETEMTAAELRTKMNKLKIQVATGVTGYQKQFEVMCVKKVLCTCVYECFIVWSDSRDGEWSVRGHLSRGRGSLQ